MPVSAATGSAPRRTTGSGARTCGAGTPPNARPSITGRFTGSSLLSRMSGAASKGEASQGASSSPSRKLPAVGSKSASGAVLGGSKVGSGDAQNSNRSNGSPENNKSLSPTSIAARECASLSMSSAGSTHHGSSRPAPTLPSQRKAAAGLLSGVAGGGGHYGGDYGAAGPTASRGGNGGAKVTGSLHSANGSAAYLGGGQPYHGNGRGHAMTAAELEAEREAQAEAEDVANGYTYMPINQEYPGLRKVHHKPPVYVVDDFLSEEECSELIKTAGPLLQRSKTHAAAGSEATKGRTSLTCHLQKKVYPCPQMLQKIQNLTNKPFGHMELPQVARYASSQRYVEHYDGVDPHTEAGRSFCSSGGQRVATVLVYLNEVSDGGCTRFKRLDLEVKPQKGMALVFFPGFMNGELDTDALHAGMPAVDTKWVSQVWIRQSFREDGQPSSPVPIEEQSLIGPLHEGIYRGLSMAGDDVYEAVMTFAEAKAYASRLRDCQGFTYEAVPRYPDEPVRVWFKSKLNILYNEDWWTYSTGKGM